MRLPGITLLEIIDFRKGICKIPVQSCRPEPTAGGLPCGACAPVGGKIGIDFEATEKTVSTCSHLHRTCGASQVQVCLYRRDEAERGVWGGGLGSEGGGLRPVPPIGCVGGGLCASSARQGLRAPRMTVRERSIRRGQGEGPPGEGLRVLHRTRQPLASST